MVRLHLSTQLLQAHLYRHHHEKAEKFELITTEQRLAPGSTERALAWSFLTGRQLIAEMIKQPQFPPDS